ncbi:hypothetical protein [Phenylobacterium sp.]|uniref:hypothetical protein n=1 Tax=Phenylobacterium sp. TaxID=1871053 RepID=UPI0018435AAF|nr:hypothetical protein [Phenylobacterium sp.]MBA4793278.1 hypothetical protein [Phenylobacterium sp.]
MVSAVSGTGNSFLLEALTRARSAEPAQQVTAARELVLPVQPVAPVAPAAKSLAPPPNPLAEPAAVTSALQQVDVPPSEFAAFAQARAAGAYGLATMPAVETLQPVAPPEPLRDVGELGFIPGEVFTSEDPNAVTDYLRGEVAKAKAAAEREAKISENLGVEVKIAFDPNTGNQTVLKPGEAGYDDVRGARASYALIGYDLEKMGQSRADFQDLLPARPRQAA